MAQRKDDGRRKMPKSFCPYCNRRVMDSKTVELRQTIKLTTADDEAAEHFIFCNHCSKLIGVIFIQTTPCVSKPFALKHA